MAARITAYLVALIVGTTLIAGLIVGAQRDDDGPVDLIVVNGNVYTTDVDNPTAEAVAVQGNKILMVGSNRDVQRLRRAQTVVVDAKGGAVLPGFNDAHVSFLKGGLALDQVDLLQARTVPEIEDAIRAWAKANSSREWVIGAGWSDEVFATGLPTRQMLDALVPDRPAYLVAQDEQTGWANSAALKLAGITRRTPNPANGVIVKDAGTGEPTGVLKNAAMDLVAALLPQPTRDQRAAAIRAAVEQAHRRGVTSVQDVTASADDLEIYEELSRKHALHVRVYAGLSVDGDVSPEQLDGLDRLRARFEDDPLFKTGAVSLTAEEHAEDVEQSARALDTLVADLDKRGWQVMIHAAGSRAIRMALDSFEYATSRNPAPARERRHRIEHVQESARDDIGRFARLGVIASMQPYQGHPTAGMLAMWADHSGDEPTTAEWPYGSIAKAGGKLAFGSGWPVAPLDPLLGLHVAVNRTSLAGEPDGGWWPGERLALRDAIDAYTRGAAWASFDEHRKGTLERDMLADIVILSQDIFSMSSTRLPETDVIATIFDGKVVFSRSAATND